MSKENPYAPPKSDLNITIGRRLFPEMDFNTVKKLRNHSHSIRTLGWLWGAIAGLYSIVSLTNILGGGGLLTERYGWNMITVIFFIHLTAAYSAIKRPRWGRIVGIVLCTIGLIGFPLVTVIALLGLMAFVGSAPLFGDNKILHKDLEREYQYRKKHQIS